METNKINNDEKHRCVFKSYYVVWKRDYELLFSSFQKSLNRTMQYGNGVELNKEECLTRV